MIALQSVSKSFNDVLAVGEVTFEVASGTAMALVGPSGAGKTTILRLVAGLEMPDEGDIILNGRLMSRSGWARPAYERNVGMVFQRPALWPHLTVRRNVQFGLGGMKRAEAEQRLLETLRLTRLEGFEHRYPHQLSGGEAQRVALARALAPRPSILLLDEPLIGLDAELNRQMIELIHAIRQQFGTTIVYVTHYLSEAEAVADTVVVLRQGCVEQVGSWQSIRDREYRE
ncbi:MAG: ABC transporter ATP-binding protein [Dehalococcoidia bacterium]